MIREKATECWGMIAFEFFVNVMGEGDPTAIYQVSGLGGNKVEGDNFIGEFTLLWEKVG